MLVSVRLAPSDRPADVEWIEVRCRGCGRLLEKIEEYALRPGKRIEIKCGRCKVVNDLVGTDAR
jgi:phage FluMu protein Com